MKKWIALALVVLLLVVGGIYLGSPIYAARSLQQAALAGDSARVAAGVDFPAVRAHLKPQLAEAVNGRVESDPRLSDSPYAAIGRLILPRLVDGAVDAFVTPEGLAALMRGRRPGGRKADQANPHLDRNAEYVGLDHFRVRLRDTEKNRDGATFLFERRGFATWKLVQVDLPPRFIQ